MATRDQCKRQLVKIAENNVELQYYLLSPVNLSKVVLTEYTVSYGQTKIDTDRVAADEDWTFWSELNAPTIADRVVAAEVQVAFFDTAQTVMNAVDGTVVELP